jgi:DNA-binding beta-propeller fold protein YncE
MASVTPQGIKNNIVGLNQRKIKVVYLLLALFATLFLSVVGWAFTVFSQRNLPQNTGSTPSGIPGLNFQYSILGKNDSMLLKPMDIVVASNRVYVTDTLNTRVQVFSTAGQHLFSFGENGSQPGAFKFPYGIEVVSNGDIFVADTENGNISVFDNAGKFLKYFAVHEEALTQPAGMYLHQDNLYVCNLGPSNILVFNINTGELLRIIGSEGDGVGQLMFPNAVVVGPDGFIYVSDTGNDRIQRYSPTGEFKETLPLDASILYSPRGIEFDHQGRLFIVSKMNNNVLVVNKNWEIVSSISEEFFNLPNGLALDEHGRVFVTDHISALVFNK